MQRLLWIGAVLLLTIPAAAQSLDELRGSTAAYYKFAEEGDITVTVKVWGQVANPGLYEVRQGTPLSTLLSLAGGPAALREAATQRTLFLRLFRPEPDGTPALHYEVTMEDEIQALLDEPTLLHGDLVLVEEQIRRRFSWRDGLSILTAVASLSLIVERLVNSN